MTNKELLEKLSQGIKECIPEKPHIPPPEGAKIFTDWYIRGRNDTVKSILDFIDQVSKTL